ncbi:MAG: XisI protein [Saprospiraceae bacterium]
MGNLNSIEQKKKIVRQTVEQIANIDSFDNQDNTIRVLDDLGGHYLLFNNAWKDGKRFYGCFLHVDVHPDGKVWLQYDGTDQNVAESLVQAGIQHLDIVLAFQPPSVRQYTEFATA